MTNEQKQLLLKDLCARLPYGFTVHRYSDNRDITFGKNELDEFSHFLEYSEGEEFKPYLRPMSSMTEEEKREYYELSVITDDGTGELVIVPAIYALKFFLSNHLDYQGLIPMGLALEAPEDMYKEE